MKPITKEYCLQATARRYSNESDVCPLCGVEPEDEVYFFGKCQNLKVFSYIKLYVIFNYVGNKCIHTYMHVKDEQYLLQMILQPL